MKHIFSLALTLVYIGVYAQTLDSSTKESFQSVTHKSADGMAENQSVYTCPMHPEVKSDKPGNCPKCGMKLVPKDNGKMHNSHGKMDMDVKDQKAIPVLPKKNIKGGKVVKYDLYVKDTIVNYGGKPKRAIAVNGQIPMPTLTFTEGDTAENRCA